MKDRSEVFEDGRPVFYAIFYNEFRKAALDCGYTLAIHGSMANDMDLIAVPWVDNPKPIETLVGAISDCIDKTIWKGHHLKNPEERPHNRVTYTLSIYSDFRIDLSVMKPSQPYKEEVDKEDELWNEVMQEMGFYSSQLDNIKSKFHLTRKI